MLEAELAVTQVVRFLLTTSARPRTGGRTGTIVIAFLASATVYAWCVQW